MSIIQILNQLAGTNTIAWSNRFLECVVGALLLIGVAFALHVVYLLIRIGSGR